MSLGTPHRRKRIEDVRCPAVKGVPNDIYHILHHSFVEILKMREDKILSLNCSELAIVILSSRQPFSTWVLSRTCTGPFASWSMR